MLLQFSVENFLSIREKLTLDLIPDFYKEHQENIIKINKSKALNSIAIYGANASGKTNLFKAITTALLTIRNSNNFQITDRLLSIIPFLFDEYSRNKPSKFEFLFIAKDNKKYVYGFSATQLRIEEEYLYVYNSKKPSLIFDRKINNNNEEYKFPRNFKAELELVAKRNTPNKLFLSTATSWNIEITKPAFEWLALGIDTYTNLVDIHHLALDMYSKEQNKEYTDFTKALLKNANINITKIDIETRELSQEETRGFPFGIFFNNMMPTKQVEVKVKMSHEVKDKDGKTKEYDLLLGNESLGTQQLFAFGPFLKKAFDYGKTIIIDEIEKSLHPFIVKYLISLFKNKEINKKGAQLIVSTHNTNLLSLDIFRRDQIYFTNKDRNTGVTDLYSLGAYESIRATENAEKAYLQGRFGAIPDVNLEDFFYDR